MHAAFSKAQTGWSPLRGVDGFCGQWGGWNECNSEEACILALWRDRAAYRFFMEHIHDTIFEKNDQARTYEGISVTLHEDAAVSRMPDAKLSVRLTPGLEKASLTDGVLHVPSEVAGGKEIELLEIWHVEGGKVL
ncbi:YdbC family protein [Tumebacillus flagellatus]|uniref:YdbC family protein n=1 Tax=Tumebacillus flagellatus TaxID=1157490 RepID=UPI000691C331|nr:YdbC family protein [Tumebacillus flagellatus]